MNASRDISIKFRNDEERESQHITVIPGYLEQSPATRRAIKQLCAYVAEVTVGTPIPFSRIQSDRHEGILQIDSMTRDNLELIRNNRDGGVEGSLFSLIDRTMTRAGGKLLKEWILNPLSTLSNITRRQRMVSLLKNALSRSVIREHLSRTSDGDRIALRLELGVVTPRELAALRDTLAIVPALKDMLTAFESVAGDLVTEIVAGLDPITDVQSLLEEALEAEPPLSLNQGGIFRAGYDRTLDGFRDAGQQGKEWMSKFEERERARTGIPSLKVKYTGVFGYFIEVTQAQLSKVPDDYSRKQTTANGERFTTSELKQWEDTILRSGDRGLIRERELFTALREQIRSATQRIRSTAQAIAILDVCTSLAQCADDEGWVLPSCVDDNTLLVEQGRHPVIAKLLGGEFVPNSISLAEGGTQCLIITGPNMGGKSTYLRQIALITVLAQMGSYVPAQRATIGVVDMLFARLGASDNLREGESTFMVEMREAATIVRQATERSLVVIDEIGRGTATLDGLALAQSIFEWLVVTTRARILFATHFHELTALEQQYPSVKNVSVGAIEDGGRIIFTHQIVSGAADRSYGLEVAERAGLPKKLLSRAEQILNAHLSDAHDRPESTRQLSLFEPLQPVETKIERSADSVVCDMIAAINPDECTPREALSKLYELKSLWSKEFS
jgi:DNA mismatch repair protein MutS